MNSSGSYEPRQIREGNAFRLNGAFWNVDGNGVETLAEWTTEVLTLEVRPAAGGAAAFTEASSGANITLDDGTYEIVLDESHVGLAALISTGGANIDGVYYWRLTLTDTNGQVYTLIFGELYVIDETDHDVLSFQTDVIDIFYHANGRTILSRR